ncbi:MAG: HK97 gp10 family phage protein [Nitrososphaeraceae archaeon]|nr:HK97 gp10 family phage protein [Nitrososphaeraceae archaeon]
MGRRRDKDSVKIVKINRDDFKVDRLTAKKMINRAAKQVVRDAKINAPVKTGNLRNKIGLWSVWRFW